MAKPFLSCQVISHQPSSHPPVSTRLPPGIFATISLPVRGAARGLTAEAMWAGLAGAGGTTQAMASPKIRDTTLMAYPPSTRKRDGTFRRENGGKGANAKKTQSANASSLSVYRRSTRAERVLG